MTPPRLDNGSWEEYKKLILSEIERFDDTLQLSRKEIREYNEKMAERLTLIQVEIGRLNVKASLWGALAGVLAAMATILIKYIGK